MSELLKLIDELEELAVARGLLRARIEFLLHVEQVHEQEQPPVGVRVSENGKPRRKRTAQDTTAARLLSLMPEHVPMAVKDLIRESGIRGPTVRVVLSDLTQAGVLARVGYGQYQRVNGAAQ